MKIKQLLPVAIIGLLGTVGTASAAPITFAFDDMIGTSMTQMGTTVDVTSNGTVSVGYLGVGVDTDSLISTGESISFTFTPNAVSLLSGVVFESAMSMSGADFNLYGDNVLLDNITFINSYFTGGTFLTTLDFDDWTATTFRFEGLSNNGFSIKKLTVDVPEPGMVAMLGLGLLLAGVATRRRRKS